MNNISIKNCYFCRKPLVLQLLKGEAETKYFDVQKKIYNRKTLKNHGKNNIKKMITKKVKLHCNFMVMKKQST